MDKIIFCALIIAGLCFGQGIWLKENQKINLPMPINGAIRTVNPLSPSNLVMQVEVESLQPKTCFWKQAGIYGVEFMGGGIGSLLSGYFAAVTYFVFHPESYLVDYSSVPGNITYLISNMVITSTCVWGIGNITSQNNSWRKASLGAGIGALAGITSMYLLTKRFTDFSGIGFPIGLGFFLGSPSLGAVIRFNIK